MTAKANVVRVFAAGKRGGNPAPIVIDADGMSDAEMRDVARRHGLESGFVLQSSDACDLMLRFFVPNHEMEMCGHATLGAVWLLDRIGRLAGDNVVIATRSGRVEARLLPGVSGTRLEISQPKGAVQALDADANAEVMSVLGLRTEDLAPCPIQNAQTSRIKTLVPLASAERLDGLSPDFSRIEAVCEKIGSTGLYPFASLDGSAQVFTARQFPKSSGYPEDAATGIAATALAFGLLASGLVAGNETPIRIHQGIAMGRPSEISVRFRMDEDEIVGCWLGGKVEIDED